MGSVFTKIINRSEPALIIWEDEDVIVFIPHANFINPGHILVVPKVQVDYIFDLEDEIYHKLWSVAKKMAKPLKNLTYAKRIGIAAEGFSVPHVHIHLAPLYNHSELDPHRDIPWGLKEREVFADRMKQELYKNEKLGQN